MLIHCIDKGKNGEYNNIKKGVIYMANTNVTMRIDETLKAQLQELMSSLGLDMTTFFTMVAKQAVREQALPFKPDMNTGIYGLQAYKLAMQNTNYNKEGKAVISSADEWNDESEWDDMFEQMKKEKGVK
jgi:addiction module RelB/DinJ family antitoxin